MKTGCRKRPYNTTQCTWETVFAKIYGIPMNQRNYSWKNSDIDKFLYDILDVFEEGRYKERMGSIINLETEEGNQIYDGQQRMITTILILISIGNLNPNLYNEVMNLLKINLFLSPLTKEQTRWRENISAMGGCHQYCPSCFWGQVVGDESAIACTHFSQMLTSCTNPT